MSDCALTNHRLQRSACPGHLFLPIQGLGCQPAVWQNTSLTSQEVYLNRKLRLANKGAGK